LLRQLDALQTPKIHPPHLKLPYMAPLPSSVTKPYHLSLLSHLLSVLNFYKTSGCIDDTPDKYQHYPVPWHKRDNI